MRHSNTLLFILIVFFISAISANAQVDKATNVLSEKITTAIQETTSVTFRVDMSNYITLGFFNPSVNKVYVTGEFNNWSLNNEMIKQSESNIYSLSLSLQQNKSYEYKFYIDVTQNCDQFEGLVSTGKNGNRILNVETTNIELPVVYFCNYTLDSNLISKEKAEIIAVNWYKHWNPDNTVSTEIKNYKGETFWGQPSFHIFNFNSGGWVAVSAIERMRPIIGYDFTGEARFIGYNIYQSHMGDVVTEEVLQEWGNLYSNNFSSYETKQVLPLLTTHWHQVWPYNAYFPKSPTYYKEEKGHYRVGCTITAATQMMKYWNYPAKGKGIVHVNDDVWGNYYYDLSDAVYDWNNMPDFLPNDTTLTEDVYGPSALLNSTFCISLENMRGELYTNWLTAWATHFGYSPTSELLQRNSFTYNQWKNIYNSELDNGRPIMMAGSGDVSGQGGHAFIIDGYQPNGYYHVNMGWADINGYLDGFYPLNNMGGHPYNHLAIIKLEPEFCKPDYQKEYQPDENTVLLMHFNGDLKNESSIGGTATSQGAGISFSQNEISELGNCVRIDNTSANSRSFLSFANNTALNLQNDWTIEAWVYIKSWNANSFLFNKQSGDRQKVNFNIQLNKSEKSVWYDYGQLGYTTRTSFATHPYILEIGKWYHFSCIRKTDTKNIQLLIHDSNDELVYYKSQPYNDKDDWAPGVNTSPLFIGGCEQGYDCFDGYIDELRISNIARNFNEFIVDKPDTPTLSTPFDNSVDRSTNLSLSWNTVDKATKYTLCVSTDSSFNSLLINETNIKTTSKNITGLSNNTSYFWRVCALNTGGSSDWSLTWGFKTALTTSNGPALISPSNESINQATTPELNWNNVPDAVSYALQVSTVSDFSSTVVNESGITSTTKAISGLQNNTTYYWRVNANNTGGTSNWSAIWNFKTIALIAGIPNLSSPLQGAINQNTSMTLNWNVANNATAYSLQVSTTSDFSSTLVNESGITSTTKAISGLQNNTTYYWRVKATNSGGTSGWSAIWNFKTIASIAGVPNLSSPINGAVNQAVNLNLNWNAANNATTYSLQVSTVSDFSSTLVNESGITATTKAINGLQNYTTYYWRVNATNTDGISGWSETWNFKTIALIAGIPNLLSPLQGAINQNTSMTLNWNAANNANTYGLQVSTTSDFSITLVDESGITGTTKAISGLENNTTYFWRVNSINPGWTSNWSETWNFKTIGIVPDGPIGGPYAPDDNTVLLMHFNNNLKEESHDYKVNNLGLAKSYIDSPFEGLNQSIYFDNSSQSNPSFLTVPYTSALSLTKSWTIEFWMNIKEWNQSHNSWPVPILLPTATWDANYYLEVPSSWGRLKYGLSSNNGPITIMTNTNSITTGTWYHVTLINDYDNHTIRILLHDANYAKIDETSNTYPVGTIIESGAQDLRIGNGLAGDNSFNGYMDELRISNKVRSIEELAVAIPDVPVLLNPLKGKTEQEINSTMSWNTVNRAENYSLQVSITSDFSLTLVNESGITTTTKAISGLQNNTTYYWRVKATNSGGTSDWSEIWNFKTIASIAGVPNLSSPINGAVDQAVILNLNWNAANNATTYSLQVSTVSDFSSTLVNESGITATTKAISGLQNNTTYYWRVKATNAGGTSNWSTIWNSIWGERVIGQKPGILKRLILLE